MKYIQKGNGDYLVLVHGALTDGSMWLPHVEYLKSDFEVVSVSLRHFEGPETGGFGLNSHADELAELLHKLLKYKPVNIVGWSYGADVVLNVLAKNDLSIPKVFLYEPGYPGCLQGEPLEDWQADANAMFGKVFEHFSSGNPELAVESLIDGSGNKQGYFKSQSKSVKELQLSKAYTLAYQLNQQEQPAIDPLSISKITVPIVFGYGQETRYIFKLVTRSAAQLSDKAELHELSGESHMLPQENPEEFSRLIKSIFLPQDNKGI